MRQFTSFKILLRWLVAGVLYHSRALELYWLVQARPSAVILTYHRVLDPDNEQGYVLDGMYVKNRTFEKQLRYLRRFYEVVTMGHLMACRGNLGKNQRPLCVITFDDALHFIGIITVGIGKPIYSFP